MPNPATSTKKQNWRFARLSSLRAAPHSFLHHPEPRAIGSSIRGEALLAHRFVFAGHRVEAPDSSIWNIRPPSAAFLVSLQNFCWLDDLAAIGDKAARKRAQLWLLEWIEAFGQKNGMGWHPALAGRRVINWCAHAMFLLKGLTPKQSNAVFKSLGRHVNFLSNNWKKTPEGLGKIEALAGMVYAGLSLEGCEYALRPALKGLASACTGWIDTDGAIPSRNPEELAGAFVLLTWVAKLLADNGHPVDSALAAAMARMAPGLRALQLGDGSLGRFHGGGRGEAGLLDQALSDAEIRGASVNSFMGYERLASGRITALVDAAAPPDTPTAHRAPLAFELTVGCWPMLGNCGPGQTRGAGWAEACATGAAHNTLTIEGQSAAPAPVSLERAHDLQSVWLSAVSHGFAQSFNLLHERRLLMATNGRQFTGEDRVFPLNPPAEDAAPWAALSRPARGHGFMLHFHLHPDVKAEKEAGAVLLTLPNREVWAFKQEGGLLCLEPSLYLDRTYTEPRPTKQIVVAGRTLEYVSAIRWSFTRL